MNLDKKVERFNKLCSDLNIPNHRYPFISEISINDVFITLKFKKLITSLEKPFYIACESEDFEDRKLIKKFAWLNLNNPIKVNHFINELNEIVDWKNIDEVLANKLVKYIEDNNLNVDIENDFKEDNLFNNSLKYKSETLKNDYPNEIRKYIKSHNMIQEINIHNKMDGITFENKDFLTMLKLGIPIGVIEHYDGDGTLLLDDEYEPFIEVKHIYKPINDIKTLKQYLEKVNYYPELAVNPSYMSREEVKNICYCLTMINNDKIFDLNTKTKVKIEIANSIPLKYNEAMKIFNKYYNETIQRKIIYGLNVGRNRFYSLSGLNELVPKKVRKKEMDVR